MSQNTNKDGKGTIFINELMKNNGLFFKHVGNSEDSLIKMNTVSCAELRNEIYKTNDNSFKMSNEDQNKTFMFAYRYPWSDTNNIIEVEINEKSDSKFIRLIDNNFVREPWHIFYTSDGAEAVLYKNNYNETITYVENHDRHGRVISTNILVIFGDATVTLSKRSSSIIINAYEHEVEKIMIPNRAIISKDIDIDTVDDENVLSFIDGYFI